MKILFIHNDLRTFVRADLNILQATHEVREIRFSTDQEFVRAVKAGVQWCDLVFGWWATWHMLAPVFYAQRFRKPVIVVGGDYDVIFDRQFRTRSRIFMDRIRRYLGAYLFPRIDRYLTFSDYSKMRALQLPYVIPERVNRIYCGLPDLAAGRFHTKRNLILSVGTIHQYDIYRKGYGIFVQSANYLPDYQFMMIGSWKDDSINLLRGWNDTNVNYPGFMNDQDLYQSMSDARVYVQVSSHEGFGLALAEAMLFECVPVVTDRGSIPEVVGDCGIYVPYGEPQLTAEAIRQACEAESNLGMKARERILDRFPIEKRSQLLLAEIESTATRRMTRSGQQ